MSLKRKWTVPGLSASADSLDLSIAEESRVPLTDQKKRLSA